MNISSTTLGKLWSVLPRFQKKRFFLVAVVLFASAIANVGGIASIMPFMRVLADPEVVKNKRIFMEIYEFVGEPELSLFLIYTGIGVLAMFVLANLFMALSIYVQQKYIQSVASWFTTRLMSGYLEQPYEFYLNHNGTELIKNVFSEVNQLGRGIMTPLMQALAKGSLALFILLFLVVVNPLVALGAVVAIGGGYLFIFRLVKKRLSRLGQERVRANRYRFRIATEALGGIKQVKLSNREDDYMRRFTPHARTLEKTKANTNIIGKVPKFVLEIIALGGILSVALVLFAVEGTVADVLPILSLYAVAGYKLMPSMQTLFQSISKMRSAAASVDIVYEDMKNLEIENVRPGRVYAKGKKQRKKRKGGLKREEREGLGEEEQIPFDRAISLKNISYRYPETEEKVIKGVNLEIVKNTTIGLVGPTGCGKTTLIDIILGLLSPQEGEYWVDDTLLDKERIHLWQRRLGYVPQDIFLADDTVSRNVALGVPEEDLDFEAVRRACGIANIDEFIRSELSDGYETVVGERGIRLSGGQRQRIGIARALYHNPDVLILDEATSALDGKTETAIMEAIHTLAHQKTIVMIAHRLTTLRDCDAIYVLEKGEIVDTGLYEELKGRNEAFQIG